MPTTFHQSSTKRSTTARTVSNLFLLTSHLAPGSCPCCKRYLKLLEHFISPCQHVRRNRQADLLRGLEIYHQLELHRSLHRQVSGLSAFENLVHVNDDAPILLTKVWPIGHEAACVHIIAIWINRWQPALCRKIRDPASVAGKHGGRQHYERSGAPSGYCGKGAFEIVGSFHRRRLEWEPQ